jgi:hypothetical protein
LGRVIGCFFIGCAGRCGLKKAKADPEINSGRRAAADGKKRLTHPFACPLFSFIQIFGN